LLPKLTAPEPPTDLSDVRSPSPPLPALAVSAPVTLPPLESTAPSRVMSIPALIVIPPPLPAVALAPIGPAFPPGASFAEPALPRGGSIHPTRAAAVVHFAVCLHTALRDHRDGAALAAVSVIADVTSCAARAIAHCFVATAAGLASHILDRAADCRNRADYYV